MGKGSEASLFERFVIMIMGLGVMLVGAYPLTKSNGGVLKYLKSKGIEVQPLEKFLDSTSKRARLKYQEIKDESEKSASHRKSLAKENELDSLTKDDKKDLDSLLDDVLK